MSENGTSSVVEATAPKKISLNFKKVSNKSAFNRDLVQNVERKEETDYVTEVRGNTIKGSRKAERKKEFVIPAQQNDNVLQRKMRLHRGEDVEREIRQEMLGDAEKALQNEEVQSDSAASAAAAGGEKAAPPETVIALRGGNEFDVSLQASAEVPSMEAYDEMPIEEFGTALLRGMGWQPGRAIGARCSKAAKPIEVKLRPKGLGLGAEQLLRTAQEQQDYEKKKRSREQEQLVVKSGAFVKIIGGSHQGKYGQIDGMDEGAGRVHICLALTKEKVSCNEAFVVAVGKQEYNDFGKCLNRDRYDDYKRKHEESQPSDRPSENIDLSVGFQQNHKHKGKTGKDGKQGDGGGSGDRDNDAADKSKKAKSAAVEERRPFIGYWLKSQLRVRVIDDRWQDGRYLNEKIIIEDVLGRDVCLCRTEGGRLLENVKMDMLETVLPRSAVQASVPVMVVAGKYEGQVGYIVERDKKKCVAYVEFHQDKTVHKLDFDYICEYVGQL